MVLLLHFLLPFQSTLPRGSDCVLLNLHQQLIYFNPRSLAGATHLFSFSFFCHFYFNPRSLAGATCIDDSCFWKCCNFNPRSLAGATFIPKDLDSVTNISIHAPSRERQHQNKLLLYSFKSSIFCELAQLKYSKIYFDVRKLIVSHSSLSCEPKLNFMFHITSHRIILHYFYSCQSICK